MKKNTNKNSLANKKYRHLIVGDGLTAAAFMESYDLASGDELVIIGKNASRLGRGAAYAQDDDTKPWSYAYLLNSPANDIDGAFVEWLVQNWPDLEKCMKNRMPDWLTATHGFLKDSTIGSLNVPRAFYGQFMEEKSATKISELRNTGVIVTVVDALAVAIEEEGQKLVVHTNQKQSYKVDSVDIAPGNPANQRIDGDESNFSAPSLFGHEERIAEHVKKGCKIFCVGTNATMLDALRLCQAVRDEKSIQFIACSPRGTLPPALIPRIPKRLTKPQLKTGHKTAQSFLDDVRNAIEKAKTSGDEMREIRAGFRAFFIENSLQNFLQDPSEARKVSITLSHWLRGGTRDTIMDFHRLAKADICQIISGNVFAIEALSNGARVLMRDNEGNEISYETGFVINCAGASLASSFDPLTHHMLENKWIKICPISRGIEVGAHCQTGLNKVRYLSPAVTVIGDDVMPMPLYDAYLLRTWVKRAGTLEKHS